MPRESSSTALALVASLLGLTVATVGCNQKDPDQAEAETAADAGVDAAVEARLDDCRDAGCDAALEAEDASAIAPDVPVFLLDPDECGSMSCLCRIMCHKLDQAACPVDPSEADCLEECEHPHLVDCTEMHAAAVLCVAKLSQDQFVCNEAGGVETLGCRAEGEALKPCVAP